jgi:hypothetical protein
MKSPILRHLRVPAPNIRSLRSAVAGTPFRGRLKGLAPAVEEERDLPVTAPFSQKLRCKFWGHDWRTAIGPRDGYFERCRRCYSTRNVEEHAQEPHAVSAAADRAA